MNLGTEIIETFIFLLPVPCKNTTLDFISASDQIKVTSGCYCCLFTYLFITTFIQGKGKGKGKGNSKAVPLQAWSGPVGSSKLRFPDFMTTAQDGGKIVDLTHRPPLPPGNTPGTHFS